MASNYDLGINSTPTTTTDTTKTRNTSNSLGQDEFLKLLVTQMENQDPLNPTSDTEWISQMAQFTALEQMQAMNQATQSQRAYSMIGKEITATEVVDSQGTSYFMEVYGNVTGVSKLNGIEYLVVYDYENEIEVMVPPSSVRTVFDAPDATTTMQLESIYNLINSLLEQISTLTAALEEQKGDSGNESLLAAIASLNSTIAANNSSNDNDSLLEAINALSSKVEASGTGDNEQLLQAIQALAASAQANGTSNNADLLDSINSLAGLIDQSVANSNQSLLDAINSLISTITANNPPQTTPPPTGDGGEGENEVPPVSEGEGVNEPEATDTGTGNPSGTGESGGAGESGTGADDVTEQTQTEAPPAQTEAPPAQTETPPAQSESTEQA